MLTQEQVLEMLKTASWSDCVIAGISFLALVKTIRYLSSPKVRLPPSPPGDPFIGHARMIPKDQPYKVYAEWAKKYGDVININVLGRKVIVANTLPSAREILENAKFSGRPYSELAELSGWNSGTPFLQYDDTLRTHRRMMLKYIMAVTSASASGMALRSQIVMFLKRLLDKPDMFREYAHVLVAGTIAEVIYGHKVTSADDEHVALVDRVVHMSGQFGSLTATLFDCIPFLCRLPAWLPGMGMKRHVLLVRELIDRAIEEPFAEAKARKLSGDSTPCMVSNLLDDKGSNSSQVHETILKHACFTVFNAGSDTTKSTVMTFFIMMARHPEVVAKAQEEIDSVIGSDADRLPTIEDRPNLPYLDCILKELYRINPPTSLGLPHTAMQDVKIRDWNIPSGTIANANIWGILHDENVYPDPEIFWPDRFEASAKRSAEKGGKGKSQIDDDPGAVIFGFGRRACPGKAFADSMLFVTIASILAVYDIRPCTDPIFGREELPELENQLGIVSLPKPFNCKIVPRTERHAQMIRELDSA